METWWWIRGTRTHHQDTKVPRTGFYKKGLTPEPAQAPLSGMGTGFHLKRGTILSPLTAILSSIAAMSCCLPVGTFLAAAGLAGTSAFMDSARPYFLGLSLLLLGFGFWQTYGAKSCPAKKNRASV